MPRWVVEGFKVYYLECRPNFIGAEGIDRVTRRPVLTSHETDPNVIITEPFFVNSKGSTSFRVKSIVDQFAALVCIAMIHPIQIIFCGDREL